MLQMVTNRQANLKPHMLPNNRRTSACSRVAVVRFLTLKFFSRNRLMRVVIRTNLIAIICHRSMTTYYFDTQPDSRLLSAVAVLHTDPISLEMILADTKRSWKICCTNPRPMRALGSLSEGIDRIRIVDRNATGASLEFGRFDVQLFVGAEITDRFDCDNCVVDPVLVET